MTKSLGGQPEVSELLSVLQVQKPWLQPHRPVIDRLLQVMAARSVAQFLNAARDVSDGAPMFVDQTQLPEHEAYESFIARTGQVPTRDNLHDLFNGVIWLSFPKTKRHLNALHMQQIARHGTSAVRGALRDAITVFDENGAVLRAPQVLVEALRQRDWKALFIHHREHWPSAQLVPFGHALLEKLTQPRKAITAHVWLIDELTDEALAASLDSERLAAKEFLPLPVLGVPGWWAPNEEQSFYDDRDVFRPPR